jgi:hypothetical protein
VSRTDLPFSATRPKSLYDHGIAEPNIACHRLKVLLAVEDELNAAPDAPWADVICAAVNRYLRTPMKRHRHPIHPHRPRDVLERLLADVLESEVEFPRGILLHARRNADPTGLGQVAPIVFRCGRPAWFVA